MDGGWGWLNGWWVRVVKWMVGELMVGEGG